MRGRSCMVCDARVAGGRLQCGGVRSAGAVALRRVRALCALSADSAAVATSGASASECCSPDTRRRTTCSVLLVVYPGAARVGNGSRDARRLRAEAKRERLESSCSAGGSVWCGARAHGRGRHHGSSMLPVAMRRGAAGYGAVRERCSRRGLLRDGRIGVCDPQAGGELRPVREAILEDIVDRCSARVAFCSWFAYVLLPAVNWSTELAKASKSQDHRGA